MNYIIHKSHTRGYANLGWLQTKHTFSFADYYDPERIGFGALRVLNDDIIQAGGGFPMHPHRNMEIISVPIKGTLQHEDNMGNITVIGKGEIQVMSAGSGILHSEYNPLKSEASNFLQVWILPERIDTKPSYSQKKFDQHIFKNNLKLIVSSEDEKDTLPINQDARIYMGHFEKNYQEKVSLKSVSYGMYLFVIEGSVRVGEEILEERDGMGISDTDTVTINSLTDSKLIAFEVPME